MSRIALSYRAMKLGFAVVCLLLCVANAEAQLQVELQLKRLQYVAYEPIIATLGITNLAGRDVDLHDAAGQPWFGFEITTREGQPIGSVTTEQTQQTQPPLRIEAGKKVTQQINLTPLYAVHDLGTYHLRAHVYFADLDKFFYSQGRVFEFTDARPIWQRSVRSAQGGTRTSSLLCNCLHSYTSLYLAAYAKRSYGGYAAYAFGPET